MPGNLTHLRRARQPRRSPGVDRAYPPSGPGGSARARISGAASTACGARGCRASLLADFLSFRTGVCRSGASQLTPGHDCAAHVRRQHPRRRADLSS